MNFFSRKKPPAPAKSPSPSVADDADKTLREKLAWLERKEEYILKNIEVSLAEAKKKAILKDKQGALHALKQKKMLEGELSKLQEEKKTIQSQIPDLIGSTPMGSTGIEKRSLAQPDIKMDVEDKVIRFVRWQYQNNIKKL